METALFDYDLPKRYIAQHPPKKRGTTKLMQLDRDTKSIHHRMYADIPGLVGPDDVVVVNNTKVIRARLFAEVTRTGKRVEIFLLERKNEEDWYCLIGRAKQVKIGDTLRIGDSSLTVKKREQDSPQFVVEIPDAVEIMDTFGHVPLPPYIDREDTKEDRVRYNTVFAERDGSVAAPTAGLNLTEDMMRGIERRGAHMCSVDLMVGLGTFAPVNTEKVEDFEIHDEYVNISDETVSAVNNCKGRVWAVGTTVVRSLESAATGKKKIRAYHQKTDLFIYPGYEFKIVDVLVTNFHMPRTSLIMLVSAFAGENADNGENGRKFVLRAYEQAKKEGYRFLSYGDSMVIGDWNME